MPQCSTAHSSTATLLQRRLEAVRVDKTTSAAIVLGVLALALTLMVLGWRAIQRRQSQLPPLTPPPGDLGAALFTTDGLYVSSTLANKPLERIAVRGLGFRSRTEISVFDRGLSFTVRGGDDVFIAAEAIESTGRATWTIDKAVEAGGLAVVTWNLGDSRLDSYFRVEDTGALLLSLERFTPQRTGSDAQ